MRLACAVAAVVLLAGCAADAEPAPPSETALAAPPRAMDWSKGNWWAYHAEIGGEAIDVALIVHEAREDGFRLGSNLSVGFFGLPFHGNVTSERNPLIGPEVWPLFAFPLAEGKEWGYTLFGYEATSAVRAVSEGAFALEARSFGQVFARYDYSPAAAWFTSLELIEPTNGTVVLSARLTAYGTDWSEAYFVEETLYETRVDHPALPGRISLEIPEGYLHVRGELTGALELGVLASELRDEEGQRLASARVVGRGADIGRLSLRAPGAATWTLDQTGVGSGYLHLQITGISASGPLAALPEEGPSFDLPALLQSTLPERPQLGHTTSTALPLGV